MEPDPAMAGLHGVRWSPGRKGISPWPQCHQESPSLKGGHRGGWETLAWRTRAIQAGSVVTTVLRRGPHVGCGCG